MVFSGFSFLFIFLPALLICYFAVPRRFRDARNYVLLAFSLIFYGFGGGSFLLLMLLSITVNWLGGLFVVHKNKKIARLSLILTVVVNLGLLGYFKYAGFLAETLNTFGEILPVPEITLPIGISFFTFQGMSYVIDVYRGDTAVQKNPLKIALYVSLFPQLIAGPIVRYADIADEIDRREESVSEFSAGLTRFIFGVAKKMLLANALGEVADAVFGAELSGISTATAWVGILAYTMQIYFDFSGYSDMAIGLGRMFGFHFLENFNYPYISCSVTEFWRRWHISLSTWFRDYVYIPLGGSRCSKILNIRNILIVWMLTGLWHGAAWNFILWGAWYGVLLLLEKFVLKDFLEHLPRAVRRALTLLTVIIGWVFFRVESFTGAVEYVKVLCGLGAAESGQAVYYILQYLPEWLCALVACLPVRDWLKNRVGADSRLALIAPKVIALLLAGLSYITLISGSFNPFLYFRF